jgi:hypothetical protein
LTRRNRKPRVERERGPSAAPAARAGTEARSGGRGVLPQLGPGAALAIILVAALVLQFGALRTPFFNDDYLFLDQAGRGSLIQTLAERDPIGNFYRPVGRQLWFWLWSRASGSSALAFHAANFALWLAVLALLFAVTRRLAGTAAALIAAALLALHYAADVPLRWASGSQDLLAVAGALGALWLHLSGRTWWAAAALLGALLSKETVALTPLVAVVASRGRGESWRAAALRAWPLGAAVVVWLLITWSVSHARGGTHEPLGVTPAAGVAALAHLLQVVAGIEWYSTASGQIRPIVAWVGALALVLFAFAAGTSRAAPSAGRESGNGRGLATGLVWALAGAVPVAAVASIWSAYFYLFALCGAAVALGTLLGAIHREWALGAIALLAWNSARSSALPANAIVRQPWNTCSRVNRHYLDRGTRTVQRYLRHMLAARPSLPPRSTIFFSGIPGSVGFQTSDGPLVRWAYRDTSLRSYFTNSFDSEKASRGPCVFLEVKKDSLVDQTNDPRQLMRTALGAILSDLPRSAGEMLSFALGRDSTATAIANATATSARMKYWLAWVEWDLGHRERALQLLSAGGFPPDSSPAPQTAAGRAALARGDTTGAWRTMQLAVTQHMLDPEAHALLADLSFMVGQSSGGVIEAYAARLLAARSPREWRRWAMAQIDEDRPLEGASSLRRYFDLAGNDGARDGEALQMAAYLRAKYPATRADLERKPPAP